VAERTFHAMGGPGRLLTVGGSDGLAAAGVARIADLEARWSRFLPNSEITLLNGLPGLPVEVSPETYELVAKAVFGWQATSGSFDPTVLGSLLAAGYDRTFERLPAHRPVPPLPAAAAPGCGGIVLDAATRSVTLPSGVTLDPGGIGKGLAGDIVARELLAAGAEGVMVDLGGDVRVAGVPPSGDSWAIAIADPHDDDRDLTLLRLLDGAVATSSTLHRAWNIGDGATAHHLIDPATGRSRNGRIVAVTVVAGEGWWAEVSTKHALALGPERADRLVNAAALFVDATGSLLPSAGFAGAAA
jgi:FAD:protein FMN transferase